ncbi:uncharacterized protein RAG0_15438 [Rhynchosporium agropyri]|uniref:F-box domain-containing protein n=1 Tax=Rhynchosporium agropyri TaxID=914238 RepID=A0A1E1LL59_9HELO|nr:uncharacterized protein RAG0_15438 [Rhynchosporium agropyri]
MVVSLLSGRCLGSDITVRTIDISEQSYDVDAPIVLPDESTAIASKTHLTDLPIEILEHLCKSYLDVCSGTCLGLTSKGLFNITEYLHPFQPNLHMRSGRIYRGELVTTITPVCLGHLLTTWMAPKYTFNHAWGKFLLKKAYINNAAEVERKWKMKANWRWIRLSVDAMGACVAYEGRTLLVGF